MPDTSEFTKTILLGDDDEDDRAFFRDALQEVAGNAALLMAENGVEVMEILRRQDSLQPDLIFLDLNMPQKNGYECLAEIKKQPALQHLPVVIMSTSIQQEAVDYVYEHGANLYIVKPSDFRKLKFFIKEILSIFKQGDLIRPSKEAFILQA